MSVQNDQWIKRMCSPVIGTGSWIDGNSQLDHEFVVEDGYGNRVFRDSGARYTLSVLPSFSTTGEQKKPTMENSPYVKGFREPMIEPFVPHQVKEEDGRKIISYGLSSYGYDLRVGNKFRIFTNVNTTVVDPKNFDERSFVDFEGEVCVIPPNSFALGVSVEYFRIPRDVLTVCLGKSTLARCGIIVNVTPFEPEWEGYVTLEFSNTTPLPAKIYANEGAAQVLFLKGNDTCKTSYKDRNGKYMGQSSMPIPPTV